MSRAKGIEPVSISTEFTRRRFLKTGCCLLLAVPSPYSLRADPENASMSNLLRTEISRLAVVNDWPNPSAEVGIFGASGHCPDAKDLALSRQEADAWHGRSSFELRFTPGPTGTAALVFGVGKEPAVGVRAGQTCYFRVAGKLASGSARTMLELRSRWLDESDRLISETPALYYATHPLADRRWAVLDGWDTAPSGAARVALALYATGAVGATTLRADGVQITREPTRFPGYVDGDEPECLWLGPREASASRRLAGVLNLVPNPSFERGVKGWRSSSGPGASIHSFEGNRSWASSGCASARLAGHVSSARGSYISMASQLIPVLGGQEYTLRATVNVTKMPEDGQVVLTLGWLDSNGAYLLVDSKADQLLVVERGVRQLEVTKPAPRNAVTAVVEVRTTGAVRGEYDWSADGFSLIADSGAKPTRPFWVGLNDQVMNCSPLTPAQDVSYDVELGVNAVRLPVNLFLKDLYKEVWPGPEAPINLDPVADSLDAFSNAGVRVLLLSPLVPWMLKNRQLDPDRYAEVGRLSAAFVRRWPGIIGVEPGNEVNASNFWPPAANPVMFVRYLSLVYRAVKEVNQAIPVLAPSCNAPLTQHGNMSIADYMKAFYQAGGGQYCDALSIHPYPYGASSGSGTDRTRSFWAGCNDCMRQLRAVRDAFHDSAKPIWITELGSATTKPAYPPLLKTITEEQQATNTVLLYDWARRQSDVQAIFYHTNASNPKAPEGDFGILEADGRLKPAFIALRSELHRTPPPYFDGDTLGCHWVGPHDASPSFQPGGKTGTGVRQRFRG